MSNGNPANWETVRRLRYGSLLKLFRDRWGYVLPDDDAGRGDLFELIMNISLAPASVDKKMRCAIETWAPWIETDEAEAMVDHINRLDITYGPQQPDNSATASGSPMPIVSV